MLDFQRRDRTAEAKDAGKPGLKPAVYDPPGTAPAVGRGGPQGAQAPQPAARGPGAAPTLAPTPAPEPSTVPADTASSLAAATSPAMVQGSRLSIGPNIKLKGVEISDCDICVIEGHVEATVNSKALEIAQPGTFTGTAVIDVAEVHGEFSGELTARTRLVVHGTGRVSGAIRYGKLVVAEGGVVNGDVKRLDGEGK